MVCLIIHWSFDFLYLLTVVLSVPLLTFAPHYRSPPLFLYRASSILLLRRWRIPIMKRIRLGSNMTIHFSFRIKFENRWHCGLRCFNLLEHVVEDEQMLLVQRQFFLSSLDYFDHRRDLDGGYLFGAFSE